MKTIGTPRHPRAAASSESQLGAFELKSTNPKLVCINSEFLFSRRVCTHEKSVAVPELANQVPEDSDHALLRDDHAASEVITNADLQSSCLGEKSFQLGKKRLNEFCGGTIRGICVFLLL